MFTLKLLGGAALENGGVPVTGRTVHRRRLALLAVLAAARGRTVGRERLVAYLWPEHPGDAARHTLSESLYLLRKAMGEGAFVAAGDELGLDPAVVKSDLAEFEEALENDDPARAVALYAGPFLDGFYVQDAPEFERWADEERQRLARAYSRALEALAESREAEGNPLGAAEWWRKLAREDPYSSRVALRLMQALDAGGERAAALRHAAVHSAFVREEIGTEPDAQVTALAARLREAPRPAPPPPMAAVPAPAAAPPSLAAAPLAPPPSAAPTSADGEGAVAVMEAPPAARPAPRGAPAVPVPPPAPRRGRRLVFAGAVGAAVVLAVVLFFSLRRPGRAETDSSVYIVLPFIQRSGGGAAALTPDQSELLLHDALSRWTDVQLVDGQRARDLLSRHGSPATLSEARRIARAAGAGRLLWGEITPLGDSVLVRGGLYDVRRDRGLVPEYTVRLGRDLRDVSVRMGELAAALLGHHADPGVESAAAVGTTSLAAWQAYQRGRLAMSRWDLGRAREELAAAVELDPGYSAAHLWLAQAVAWTGHSEPPEWRGSAARALADSGRLSGREQELAHALLSLGDLRFPEACARYEALVARDSADFAAWFGLGECNRRDKAVVPDPSSPSKWSFRGSYHRAVEAYGRALRTVPSSHRAFRGAGFARLSELLQTDEYWLRPGSARQGRDTLLFAAYPSLEGDTLAFVPWPTQDVAAVKPGTVPATRAAAASRNRRVLRDVLLEWARAFPQSADAHEALALGLEAMGEIREVREGQPSAFGEVRQARALTRDADQQLRLSVAQVRMYLRVSDFRRARALSDSVLSAWREPGTRQARLLAPLAVLTGRVDRARELMLAAAPEQQLFFTAAGRTVQVPPALSEAQVDALVYGALGLRTQAAEAEARLERLIRTWVTPGERETVRSALLSAPRRLSLSMGERARRAPLAETDFVVEGQQLLARGDAAGARARLAAVGQGRGERYAGDLSLDFLFPEAALHLALGDTARALEELDRSLMALEALPPFTLESVEETAGLLRALRLRADLARARRDQRTAATWSAALSTLWSGADPPLREGLRR